MAKYRGKHGVVGSIAFWLTGLAYKIFGVSSKWFGKILFFTFLKGIPMIFKKLVKLLFLKL